MLWFGVAEVEVDVHMQIAVRSFGRWAVCKSVRPWSVARGPSSVVRSVDRIRIRRRRGSPF